MFSRVPEIVDAIARSGLRPDESPDDYVRRVVASLSRYGDLQCPTAPEIDDLMRLRIVADRARRAGVRVQLRTGSTDRLRTPRLEPAADGADLSVHVRLALVNAIFREAFELRTIDRVVAGQDDADRLIELLSVHLATSLGEQTWLGDSVVLEAAPSLATNVELSAFVLILPLVLVGRLFTPGELPEEEMTEPGATPDRFWYRFEFHLAVQPTAATFGDRIRISAEPEPGRSQIYHSAGQPLRPITEAEEIGLLDAGVLLAAEIGERITSALGLPSICPDIQVPGFDVGVRLHDISLAGLSEPEGGTLAVNIQLGPSRVPLATPSTSILSERGEENAAVRIDGHALQVLADALVREQSLDDRLDRATVRADLEATPPAFIIEFEGEASCKLRPNVRKVGFKVRARLALELTDESIDVDVEVGEPDLDNSDAALCVLTGLYLLVVPGIIALGKLIRSSRDDRDDLTSSIAMPLVVNHVPRTESRLELRPTSLAPYGDRAVRVAARLDLLPDTDGLYAYVRIQGASEDTRVQLVDQDVPPPPGDDGATIPAPYRDPPLEITERERQVMLADDVLDEAGGRGLVQLRAGSSETVEGFERQRFTVDPLIDGRRPLSGERTVPLVERAPDLFLRVLRQGRVIVDSRAVFVGRLFEVDFENRRLGTPDDPVRLFVPPTRFQP